MKRFLFAILFWTTGNTFAQNLAPNPSFEDYVMCPGSGLSFMGPTSPPPTALNWYQASAGTADYFNICALATSPNSVPANFTGYQYPRTGNGYAGIHATMTLEADDYREYLETELPSALLSGHRYYVGYWINLADFRNLGNVIGIDQMGALFRDNYIDNPLDYAPIMETPQVVSPVGVTYTDTSGWHSVGGIFTASGTEKWMILGNFTEAGLLAKDTVYKEGLIDQVSYYHIEDVCVIDMEGDAGNTFTHDTTLCIGQSLLLTAPDTLSGFIWDDGTVGIARAVDLPGVYWFKSVNLNTCSLRMDTFKIRQERSEWPLHLGADTLICRGTPFTLDAYDPVFDSYRWNTGSTTPDIKITEPGEYYVTATSDCYTGTDTIIVRTVPKPEVVLPGDTMLCKGVSLQLTYYREDNQYHWSTGSEECCISVNEPGIYSLMLTNRCGENATDEIELFYSGCDNCLVAPNAFSPNSDGLNDRFKIQVNCVMKDYKFSIFNRWGQLVFAAVKPDESWDGFINGKPADVGVYFYFIEATPAIEGLEKISKKADITLIR